MYQYLACEAFPEKSLCIPYRTPDGFIEIVTPSCLPIRAKIDSDEESFSPLSIICPVALGFFLIFAGCSEFLVAKGLSATVTLLSFVGFRSHLLLFLTNIALSLFD